jgi:OOP family OmpA-OmpF porin
MNILKPFICLLGACGLVAMFGTACAGAFPEKDGYLIDQRGSFVWNGTGGCWHTIHWTPEIAFEECDPGMHKEIPAETKAVAASPTPPSPPTAAVKPEPMAPAAEPEAMAVAEKPAVQANFSAEALFDFDMAVIKPAGRKALDEEIVTGMRSHPEVALLIVTGHADRIGTEAYNLRLSERRANAVRNYLVQQGVPADRIRVVAKGESEPDPAANTREACRGLRDGSLIACLQPDRRVIVISQAGMAK